MMGQVTPTPTPRRDVEAAIAPEDAPDERTVSLASHPRMEVVRDGGEVEADLSARVALRTSSSGGCSSLESVYPNEVTTSRASSPPPSHPCVLRPCAAQSCHPAWSCHLAGALPAVLRRVGRVRDLGGSGLGHALLLERLVLLLVLDVCTLGRHVRCVPAPRNRETKPRGVFDRGATEVVECFTAFVRYTASRSMPAARRVERSVVTVVAAFLAPPMATHHAEPEPDGARR